MKTSISKTVGTLCLSLLSAVALCLVSVPVSAQDTLRHEVLMETSMGNIRLALYNETPLHRDNFIKNVREGVYDGLLFHRVISSFMIQGGDTASRNAAPGQQLGDTEESYSIPAEIRYPQLFHKRGALAAAREGDNVNPERRSSATQFYIVYGRRHRRAIDGGFGLWSGCDILAFTGFRPFLCRSFCRRVQVRPGSFPCRATAGRDLSAS